MLKREKVWMLVMGIVVVITAITPMLPHKQEQEQKQGNSQIAFYYTENNTEIKTDTIPEGYVLDTYSCSNNNVNISWNYNEAKIKITTTGASNCKVYLKEDPFFAYYVAVEYIESTGTQYIDTGINPSNKAIGVDITFQYNDLTHDKWFFGENNYSSGDVGAYQFGIYSGSFHFMMTSHNKTNISHYIITGDTNKHNLKYNITNYGTSFDGTFIQDGIEGANGQGYIIDTAESNLYVFGRGGNVLQGYMANIKIYGLKIYESTSLIRNYIPCYRKSDGEAGLYDVLNGVFYTSLTSVPFVVSN